MVQRAGLEHAGGVRQCGTDIGFAVTIDIQQVDATFAGVAAEVAEDTMLHQLLVVIHSIVSEGERPVVVNALVQGHGDVVRFRGQLIARLRKRCCYRNLVESLAAENVRLPAIQHSAVIEIHVVEVYPRILERDVGNGRSHHGIFVKGLLAERIRVLASHIQTIEQVFAYRSRGIQGKVALSEAARPGRHAVAELVQRLLGNGINDTTGAGVAEGNRGRSLDDFYPLHMGNRVLGPEVVVHTHAVDTPIVGIAKPADGDVVVHRKFIRAGNVGGDIVQAHKALILDHFLGDDADGLTDVQNIALESCGGKRLRREARLLTAADDFDRFDDAATISRGTHRAVGRIFGGARQDATERYGYGKGESLSRRWLIACVVCH